MTTSANAANPADTMHIELSTGGTISIEMLPDRAPAHVERIKELTRDGFYDGIVFHRVIDGFMAQTGDPTGTGIFLTGQYTVWGQVTSGMEHVDAIAKGEPPADPDKIVKATIASDAAKAEEAPKEESEAAE